MRWVGLRVLLGFFVAGVVAWPVVGVAGGFWEDVLYPDRPRVRSLIGRARAELDRGAPGGVTARRAQRALLLLDAALAHEPGDPVALFLRGDALAVLGRSPAAIAALAAACDRVEDAGDEAACTLRLGIEQSRAGALAEALASYDRHLALGDPSPEVYANSAEVLMATGRLGDAIARYRAGIAFFESLPVGHAREGPLALAWLGLATALDRDGQPSQAAAAAARAVVADPALTFLEGAGEPGADVFFVPPEDLHYYRGMALASLQKKREAATAFRRYLHATPDGPWGHRVIAHLGALGEPVSADLLPSAPATPRPPAAPTVVPGVPWRIVAAATTEAKGGLQAPLLDITWKGHKSALEKCFSAAPALSPRTQRVAVDVQIDEEGRVRQADVSAPAEWEEAAACVRGHVTKEVRFPKADEPTTARLSLVLSRV